MLNNNMVTRSALMKPSLARFSLALFIALEIALIVSMLTVYWLSTPVAVPQLGKGEQPLIAQQIENMAQDVRQTARLIARHPQTVACLKTGAEALCRTQAANIYALNEGAQIYLVPAQSVESQAAYPAVLPEAYTHLVQPGQTLPTATSNFGLTVSEPVRDGSQLLGHVVLTQAAPHLQELFDGLPLPGGYLELRQYSTPGVYSVVQRRGDENLKTSASATVLPLSGTPWKLAVWRAQPSMPLLSYFTVWLVLSLLLATMVWLVQSRLRVWMSEDLNAIVSLVTDIRRLRVRSSYPVNLIEFEKPVSMLIKLAQLTVGKQKQVETEASLDHLSQVYNRRSFEVSRANCSKPCSRAGCTAC